MRKEDLIDLIKGKRESEVKMTHYVLMDMTKKRGIKNYTVLTKRELQETHATPRSKRSLNSEL